MGTHSRTDQPRLCELCGAEFWPEIGQLRKGHGRFCSKRCRALTQFGPKKSARVVMTCQACGKESLVPASVAAKRTFCSVACSLSPSRTCEGCGASFRGHARRRFCSIRCSSAAGLKQKPKQFLLCETCGERYLRRRSDRGRFCSRSCAGGGTSQRIREAGHVGTKGGRRADLDNRYFRSSWEANWARYLNCLLAAGQVSGWEFESETFEFAGIRRGARFYTPDFKVTNADGTVEYHEIKGWMDQRSQTKLRRMAKYHPSVRVLVIEKAAYTEVCRKIGPLLPNWEWAAKKAKFH